MALSADFKKHDVTVWTPFAEEAAALCRDREHKKLLPGTIIPESIKITTDLQQANDSDMVILAVPSIALRETARRLQPVRCDIVVNVAKGIERGTNLRLSQVLEEELPGRKIVEACGSVRVLNMALLGAASASGAIGLTTAELCERIREMVPQKLVAMNEKALSLGANSVNKGI